MSVDELIDERLLQELPSRTSLEAELDVMLEQLPEKPNSAKRRVSMPYLPARA